MRERGTSDMTNRPIALVLGGACALSLLTGASAAPLNAAPPTRPESPRKEVPLSIPGLPRFTTVDLSLPMGVPDQFQATLPIAGENLTLSLTHRSLRSDAFQVVVQREHGFESVDVGPARTYRGSVVGREDAGVAVSLIDGALTGLIDMGDAGLFYVQPARDFDPSQPASRHVVYNSADAIAPPGICGNGLIDLGLPDWMKEGGMGGEGGIAGAQPNIAEIGFDADFEFYQKNGSSVTNTVNDIESVMNGVEFIYDRDVNITYEFTTFVVRATSSDPYTTNDIGDLLCEFRTTWNATPESGIQRDVAQLYSGKSMVGSVIGLAWLGVVCNQSGNDCSGFGNLAYSTVESRYTLIASFRQSLSAHEIGHNWGATHCDGNGDCHIMCSGNGGCDGISGSDLKFGAGEVAEITAFKATVACDQVAPLPLDPPFLDTIPNTSLDATKWIYINGAASSTAATNEPSATRSINLDSTGANDYDDDEIRSNVIQLGGLTSVDMSYYTQHKGVESGETLVVQYWSATGDWLTLNTITSDGVDQNDFVQWTHALPGNARHDGFRMRFVVNGNDTGDDWYIDDISVGVPVIPPPANDECTGAINIGTGSTAFDSTNATNSPISVPAGCDEGNGVTMVKDIWYTTVAQCNGTMTISTCGTVGFDTRLAIYANSCPTAGSAVVACDDNTAGCANNTSSVTFNVTSGSLYYIRVGGAATGGTGTLSVNCTPIVVPPANDECTSASLVNVGTTNFDTTNASDSPISLPATCNEGGGTTIAKDIWYIFVAPCSGDVTISTCGTAGFDTRLAAYSTCPIVGTPAVACDDNTAGCSSNTSSMTFSTNVNGVYYVRVGGATTGGAGSLNISCVPVEPPCVGDFNDDGAVNGADLAVLLGAWGTAGGDLDNNGTTDGADLAALLGAWGTCP
jgi:hypothetical protein